ASCSCSSSPPRRRLPELRWCPPGGQDSSAPWCSARACPWAVTPSMLRSNVRERNDRC
ncbi:unnamed protein product, partial [Prorocentrum cordatum]